MKFGSKRVIFGVIWLFFEGSGPCLGITHIWEKPPEKNGFFGGGGTPLVLQDIVIKTQAGEYGGGPPWMSTIKAYPRVIPAHILIPSIFPEE